MRVEFGDLNEEKKEPSLTNKMKITQNSVKTERIPIFAKCQQTKLITKIEKLNFLAYLKRLRLKFNGGSSSKFFCTN